MKGNGEIMIAVLPPIPKDKAPIADKPPASLEAWISLPIPPFLLRSTRAVK